MNAEFLLDREKNRELTIYTVSDQAYRVHFHSHIELCLVLDGEMEALINDQSRLLREGEISVAWSYDTHGYHTPAHSSVLSVIIPPHLFHEFLPILHNARAKSSFLSNRSLFDRILGWIREIEGCDDALMKKGYLYLILSTLIQNTGFEEASVSADSRLSSRILLYLNEHFRENITLSSVARALGYHPNYLSQMFKSTLKIGFTQYVSILRLREALLLIQEGNRSMIDCAFECGFQSLRTFYRAFQAEFGCAPRELISEFSLSMTKK